MTDPHADAHDRVAELLNLESRQFEEGFVDRVLDRLDSELVRLDLSVALATQFRRWAPIGLAAGLALMAFNVSQADTQTGQTLTQAAIGLDPVDVENGWYTIELPFETAEGTP